MKLNTALSLCALLVCCIAAASAKKGAARLAPVEMKKRVVPVKLSDTPSTHSLTMTPLNTVVMLGDTVVLECEAAEAAPTSRVQWWEFVTTGNGQMISDGDVLLPSHPNTDRYTIIMATATQFFLQIEDVRMEDGGTYVCLDGNSGPPATYSGQAELVVLEANPNCTNLVSADGIVMEGQNYTMSCELNYGGNMPPFMEWTGPEPFISTIIQTADNVWSGMTFTVDREMDTRAYRCVTNFTAPAAVPGGVADNAPTYEHIYQSNQLFVYWGPKNLYAVPLKTSYEVGDIITCYADAFPAAFYQWANMLTLEVFSSQMFNITADMAGLNTTLRCQAQNLVQGFLYSANLFINAYVPPITTAMTTESTTPTTTPPADAPCDNLTGWWISDDPYAELHLTVASDQTGKVLGFMRNYTDQQWVEVIGRTRISDYAYLGLSAIWPYEIGVTGMAAECHKCSGVEQMMTSGNWRSSADSATCGDGGTPTPYTPYLFHRVSDTKASIHSPDFDVYKPSRVVSGRLGIKHLQY